ncbi:MAG TPA: DPP IV N-terminal domain-containing protein [Longimicrobiales bacterium]|nr:DPP IV N-terminal domain-containing protein [Longimicrobiales bacterium]
MSATSPFRRIPLPALALALTLAAAAPMRAQQPTPYRPPSLSAADYARAERFLGTTMNPLVLGGAVRVNWLEADRFWYRNDFADGAEFVAVDPAKKTRARAFDHEAIARGLSAATGKEVKPFALPFTSFEFVAGGIAVEVDSARYVCDPAAARCDGQPGRSAQEAARARSEVRSPDGKQAAFIRSHNLWVRDVATGAETQLTRDGIPDYGYATNNAGWVRSDRPVLLWSPDSRKIATFQHDARGVGEMGVIGTTAGHPKIDVWKYPLPEDTVIFRISRVVVHLDGPRVVRLQMPPDQHRSTICDHISCGGEFTDVQWSPDASQLAFVSSSRDHKEARLRVADPGTGAVRDVLDERVATFFESGDDQVNWRVLFASKEVLWWSQRDDWGHLYLYDLVTGQLKRQVTSGAWNVLQVRHVDEAARTLWFTGAGKEPGDPYFERFYSVSLDKGEPRLLAPDSATHTITVSPSGKWFVDSWSTPVKPPVSVLRDMRGRELVKLETADISRLVAAGWKAPIPFVTKARDGVTDLHGLMYTPTSLDPSRRYPVVNYIYPGPQTGSVGSRSFSAARRDHQALAELGFVVVEVDGMGSPKRSKSFHTAYYGNMGDNGLPDQIATIRQLAGRHAWIDLDRVGIWGHSGGGFASTAGILRFPDFYKVAVSQAGNHDNRIYEDDWGEKYQGLLVTHADGTTSYDNQANQLVAKNLKGKLLLAHGTVDDNVPPNNTLAVVDALIAANKDFDLIMMPNRRHGFGNEPYMQRRRWDYFVKNLMGAEPPKEYLIGRK